MKMLFVLIAAGGLVVFYLEQKKAANEAGVTALPISSVNTSGYDNLLQTTLLPNVAAGQVVNPDSTKPYTEADPTIPGGILVHV